MAKVNKEKQPKSPLRVLISTIFEGVFYFVLTALVITSLVTNYAHWQYLWTFVEGPSMYPTLNANEEGYLDDTYHEYGYVDDNKETLRYLDRFDVVVCYFPKDYNSNGELIENADRKVKRLIGFPNETIELSTYKDKEGNNIRKLRIKTPKDDELKEVALPYDVNDPRFYIVIEKYTKTYTFDLKDDEYLVIGDNWQDSKDSRSSDVGPIHFHHFYGVLMYIEGRCTVNESTKEVLKTYPYIQPRYFK